MKCIISNPRNERQFSCCSSSCLSMFVCKRLCARAPFVSLMASCCFLLLIIPFFLLFFSAAIVRRCVQQHHWTCIFVADILLLVLPHCFHVAILSFSIRRVFFYTGWIWIHIQLFGTQFVLSFHNFPLVLKLCYFSIIEMSAQKRLQYVQ